MIKKYIWCIVIPAPSNEGDVNDDDFHSPNSNWIDSPFPQVHDKKYGYNELENQRMDLCLLVGNEYGAGGGREFSH